MSRAAKDAIIDEIVDLGGSTGFGTPAFTECMSGADLEQARLTALNGDTTIVAAGGQKTLGVNSAFGGSPNSAALTGGDLERMAGSQ